MSKILYPILILFSLIILLFFIYEINYITSDQNVLAGDLFLAQITYQGSLKIFFLSAVLFIITRIITDRYSPFFVKYSEKNIFLLIILFSLIFKLFLIDYHHGYDIRDELINIFDQGMFNQYRTYSYLALFISQLTDHTAKMLTILNSLMSSFTIGLIYLILKKIKLPISIILFSILLLIGYVPFQANDFLLRVDNLFIFLFTLMIFLSLDITDKYTFKKLVLLNILGLTLCFTRESTLYLLPIFVLILLLCKQKKLLSILTISITIISSSFFISILNKHYYGMSSYVKNYHLIIKMQNYGYLNQNIIDRYIYNLSPEAKSLLKDIKKDYDLNVLPHKREKFIEEKFSVLQDNSADSFLRKKILNFFQYMQFQDLGYLIRPDLENVVAKNSITEYQGDLDNVRNKFLSMINKSDSRFSNKYLNENLKKIENKLLSEEDKSIAIYARGIILDKASDCLSKNTTMETDKDILDRTCIVNKVREINRNFMINKSDNWTYKKIAQSYTWQFDKDQKKYLTHPYVNEVERIMLSDPELYVAQSLITLFSMTGYVPIPSAIAAMGNIYSKSIFPNLFLLTAQKIYIPIINFWYMLCFIIFIMYAFKSILDKKFNIEILFAIIPLYYISFIAFASPFEFNRLIMPSVPYVFICFSIVLHSISNIFFYLIRNQKSLKNIS